MVLARLGDGFGLGAVNERRIGEPRGEPVAVLCRDGDGLGEAGLLGVEINETLCKC